MRPAEARLSTQFLFRMHLQLAQKMGQPLRALSWRNSPAQGSAIHMRLFPAGTERTWQAPPLFCLPRWRGASLVNTAVGVQECVAQSAGIPTFPPRVHTLQWTWMYSILTGGAAQTSFMSPYISVFEDIMIKKDHRGCTLLPQRSKRLA